MNKDNETDQDLVNWLQDAEQIPEEGETTDEFIKRTNWTLEEENYWRKIDGMPALKDEQEYRNLLNNKQKKMNANKEFYTAQELADKLRVNVMTIYRYIKAGKVKAYKIGKEFRIDEKEYNKFLNKTKTK